MNSGKKIVDFCQRFIKFSLCLIEAVIMQEGGWKDTNMMMRYLDRRKSMRKNIAENYSQYLKKKSATVVDLQETIVKKL